MAPLVGPPDTKPLSANTKGYRSKTLTCHHRSIDATLKFLIKFLTGDFGVRVCELCAIKVAGSSVSHSSGASGDWSDARAQSAALK